MNTIWFLPFFPHLQIVFVRAAWKNQNQTRHREMTLLFQKCIIKLIGIFLSLKKSLLKQTNKKNPTWKTLKAYLNHEAFGNEQNVTSLWLYSTEFW